MSKKSRTFQPPTATDDTRSGTSAPAGDAASTPVAGDPATPTAATPTAAAAGPTAPVTTTSRSAARRRATSSGRVSSPPSFFERYRAVIIGAVAILVVGGTVAVVANMSTGSANAYECTTLLTPGPVEPVPTPRPATPVPSVDPAASPETASTPEPQPTQRLGFPAQDLGRGHADPGTKIEYDYCPPTSGSHYNIGGRAPLTRQFYPPTTELGPGNWIHNLEHGYVVLLYRGEPTAEIQQQLQDIMAEAAPTATSAEKCGYSKVIAARFDGMDASANFAAIAWDRALLLDEFDKEQLLAFANQWQDGPQTPEADLC